MEDYDTTIQTHCFYLSAREYVLADDITSPLTTSTPKRKPLPAYEVAHASSYLTSHFSIFWLGIGAGISDVYIAMMQAEVII